MEENDLLVSDSQSIKIGLKTYYVNELSLKQTILLSRFVARTILTSQSKLKELRDKTSGSKSNVDDLISILELIEDKDTYELFSIILKEDDVKYLEDNLKLINSTEIIAMLCEKNDFGTVKKNITRIIKAINQEKQSKMH